MVDAVENLAPQAIAIRWRLVRLVLFQPFVQAQQLAQGPAQVDGQAGRQRPGILAGEQAEQQAGAD
ncbi:hypothetical protein D3C80_1665570 [compost metagenome]